MAVIAYISPVIGDGKSIETAYRLSVADYAGQNSRFYIDQKVGIVHADADAHAKIAKLPNVRAISKAEALQLIGHLDDLGDVP